MSAIVARRSSSLAPSQSRHVTSAATEPATIWPTGSVPEMSTTASGRPSSRGRSRRHHRSRSRRARSAGAARRECAAGSHAAVGRRDVTPSRGALGAPALARRAHAGAALSRLVGVLTSAPDASTLPVSQPKQTSSTAPCSSSRALPMLVAHSLRQESGHGLVLSGPDRRVAGEAVARAVRPRRCRTSSCRCCGGLVPPEVDAVRERSPRRRRASSGCRTGRASRVRLEAGRHLTHVVSEVLVVARGREAALSGEVGHWVCESASPSGLPASASGTATSIVPWRQLSKTQLSAKLPSLLPAQKNPVPTGCGTSGVERVVRRGRCRGCSRRTSCGRSSSRPRGSRDGRPPRACRVVRPFALP